jgi:subtilisin family serine protease
MHLRRRALVLAVALAAGSVIPTGATAADPTTPPATTDEILVRYADGTTAAQRRAVGREAAVEVVSTSADGRTEVVVGEGVSRATVRRRLDADPRVVAIAPNYQRELADEITDEQYFPWEWGLHNTGQTLDGVTEKTGVADVDIDGLEALRIARGDADIVVAVIDDGVDFSHPDLAGRAWTNPGETPNDGEDNDGNGFVDDVNGWDFCDDDRTVQPASGEGHGTHVAGTIAASLNGSGAVGVAPGIKIMALRFIERNACGSDDQAVAAIDYARDFGVPIINASWGGAGASSVLDLAIAESGALFVAAAGNAGVDLDSPNSNFYPAESNVPNVLSVGAIDQAGVRAVFSNIGASGVDLMAPGTNILSSFPGGYAWSDGTSMAAPHVSGVAALAASTMSGPITAVGLRKRVTDSAMPLAGASCITATGRLVNALRTISTQETNSLAPCSYRLDAGAVIGSSIRATVAWPSATGDLTRISGYTVLRRLGTSAWVTAATTTSRSLRQSLTFGTVYRFVVRTRGLSGAPGRLAYGPSITPTLHQETTSLATYSGRWTTTTSTAASGRRLRTSGLAGSFVQFRRTSVRAIAVVGRQGPTSGQARIYVDGKLVSTIDLRRSVARNRVVLFSRSWPTPGTHTVKVVVVGTSGRPRVDIDGFVALR